MWDIVLRWSRQTSKAADSSLSLRERALKRYCAPTHFRGEADILFDFLAFGVLPKAFFSSVQFLLVIKLEALFAFEFVCQLPVIALPDI